MARARRTNAAILGVGFFLLPVLGFPYQCHTAHTICTDPHETSCLAIATSLRPLSLLANTDSGWNTGGACGTVACYLILRCPCGDLLGASVCDDIAGGGGGTCDCGPAGGGGPCEYSVTELNLMLNAGKASPSRAEVLRQPEALYQPEEGSRELASRYKGTLDHLRGFYKSIRAAHLETGVWVNFPDRTGEGAFDYWLEGQKYRSRSTADARLGLASGLVSAYDGERYQLLFEADSRLSLYREPPAQVPAPFMNPLYLPVAFLSSEGDGCPACELTLDAIADETRWRSRVGEARGLAEKGGEGRLILPGGRLQGRPFYYRVTVLPNRDLVSKIEYVRPGGKVFRVVDFSRYLRVKGSTYPFPQHILLTGLDDDGKRVVSLHFMVKSLQLNMPIEPERFTIPFSEVRTIIDEDQPTFLQHPQMKKDGKKLDEH
jgi:hypothetical protein